MRLLFRLIGLLILILFLTVITQVGGVILVLVLLMANPMKWQWWKISLTSASIYLICTLFIIPLISPLFGRDRLPVSGKIRPHHFYTVLLNRNYVNPLLSKSLEGALLKMSLQYPEVEIVYMEANFPFWNGFPLFPHLSHNDGNKVDLAFYYSDKSGHSVDYLPSWLGYGAYEKVRNGEPDTGKECMTSGFWQYEILRYLAPFRDSDLEVDEKKTAMLIKTMSMDSEVEKIFLEPYLKERWGLDEIKKVRFHGCYAVSHADHIHVQIKEEH